MMQASEGRQYTAMMRRIVAWTVVVVLAATPVEAQICNDPADLLGTVIPFTGGATCSAYLAHFTSQGLFNAGADCTAVDSTSGGLSFGSYLQIVAMSCCNGPPTTTCAATLVQPCASLSNFNATRTIAAAGGESCANAVGDFNTNATLATAAGCSQLVPSGGGATYGHIMVAAGQD
jgi:hypothetical protein